MRSSLRDRINDYLDRSDTRLLPQVPIVIVLNGRGFSKITALIDKPYSETLMEIMCGTLIKLCQEVEGVVFGFTFNDQIILICRNDQNSNFHNIPWYDGSTQLISSASSALATYEFNQLVAIKELPLVGSPIFTSTCFTVPNITEVVNALCHYQQQAFHTSLSNACFYEMIKTSDAEEVKNLLDGKNPSQKNELLISKCGITYNDYPLPFKRGVGCYRAAKVVNGQKEIKYKLTLDTELPLFSQEKSWLFGIFNGGGDVLRLDAN
jgi:tRNA(His) 5'-end guanylyltransferase